MITHRRKLLPFCIAAALLSGPAAAVGLGEIQLTSFLGAPLQAEVALNSLGELSADQLKVQVGSDADYEALGVEYNYLHTLLKIEPFVRDGHGYVRISTREPISEPYLNFVLNVQWPQGRVVREFTVLLDPAPVSAVAAAQPERARLTEPATARAETSQPVPRARRTPPASTSTPMQSLTQAPSSTPTQSDTGDYIVQRGDSLWRIASRLRPQNAELQQVMNAIVAQNPHAFVDGNPDRIKEAAHIVVPSVEHIAAAALPATAPTTERAPDSVAKAAVATPVAPAELAEENSALKAQVTALTGNVEGLNRNLELSEQRLRQMESQLDVLLQQMQQQRTTLAALTGTSTAVAGAVAPATGSMINQVNAAELYSAPIARTPWWVHLLYWLGIGGAAMWAIREHFWPQRRFAALEVGDSGGLDSAAPLAARATPAPVDHSWRKATRYQPLPVLDEQQDEGQGKERDEGLNEALADFDLDESITLAEAPELAPPALEPLADEAVVDVNISAGVFLAFGRYDEAERLLRDALQRAPEHTELKLQLLDVYLQADQREQFDALAEAIEQGPVTAEILAELAVLRESYRVRGH